MQHQILFRAALISLLAQGLAACSHTAPVSAEPTLTIPVRAYPAERQQRLAAEIMAAPASAVWPEMLGDYSTLRRAACAVTPRQEACRQICNADGNRHAFCSRTR